jgi:hypothetical protein
MKWAVCTGVSNVVVLFKESIHLGTLTVFDLDSTTRHGTCTSRCQVHVWWEEKLEVWAKKHIHSATTHHDNHDNHQINCR